MILEVEHLCREFMRGKQTFLAVSDVSFQIEKGEMVVLTGQSGSGKSTLFHMLTGMIQPTRGKITLFEQDLSKLKPAQISNLRGSDLGYIMQGQNLLQNLTVMENILLPFSLRKGKIVNRTEINDLLELLGLTHLQNEYPANLSGGEQRRVSIARTFAQNPKLVIADEPTSNLDPENARIIMEYFKQKVEEGTSVLVSTHNMEFVNYANRCLQMEHGRFLL